MKAIETHYLTMASDAQYREAARDEYGNDEIEIDDDAKVSPSEHGAFVQAWVWVKAVEGVPENAS